MKIENLRVDHIENPLGFAIQEPVISWVAVEAEGDRMASARVEIADDTFFQNKVFDSGTRSDIDPASYKADFRPEEATRYFVRVTETDDAGDTACADGWFETPKSHLDGQWIKAPAAIDSAVFMKKFHIDQEIVSARLYITGLGLYEAYINGEKVGNELLAPFYNDYNLWIQYQTYDVTGRIRSGDNAIGIMLGNGWYKGRFGFVPEMDHIYGDTQQFIMDLVIRMADGSQTVISSDTSFRAHESPFLEDSIYDGEVYDCRKEIPRFSEADCNIEGGGWTNAEEAEDFSDRLCPRYSPYLIRHEAVKPANLIHTPAGEQVLDFGQEVSAVFSFRSDLPEGSEVRLQFGEILQNDNFYNENLRTAKQELVFISDGRQREYHSHFTFYGFRYVKVEGIDPVSLDDFTAWVLHSDMKETGFMETDDPKVNRLIQNVRWGQKGNFVDVPTDCPQRDERMGWTGDANVFCATASYNYYTPAFYRKYMHDMLLEQQQKGVDGAVPHVVPDILDQINVVLDRRAAEKGEKPEEHTPALGSSAWGDAATVIPWTEYVFFGDRELLAEEYPNMKGWVDWIRRNDEERGGKHLFDWGFHFGDWLALDNYHQGSSFGGTDNTYVASAYYLYSSGLTAKAAKVLGYEEDAARYTAYAEDVRKAMQQEFFTPTGRCAVDTQTALVLAIHFGIVSGAVRDRAIRDLKKKLDEENIHLRTGFVGTAYLCKTLSEAGLDDYAYQLLLNEDYPSWLYEVNMGATTIWERWNSVLPDGSMSDTGMNSLNHYAYGAVLEWMYRFMGGINPDEDAAGFRRFTIAPRPNQKFKFCKTRYDSVRGMITSEWNRSDAGWKMEFTVPFDTECVFVVPDGAEKAVLRSGDQEIAVLKGGESHVCKKGAYTVDLTMK